MMNKRNALLLLLVGFIALVPAWSAGQDEGADSATTQEDLGYTLTEPGTFPIVEGEVAEISVMVEDLPTVASFTDNELTDWYEDKTNVVVNWDVIPQEGYEEQLSLTIASGDLPDYIGSGLNRSTITVYGQDGAFVPVNDLIDEHSYWLKGLMDDIDGLRQSMVASDGNIYGFPRISECYHCHLRRKMWIYQPWLDELGLDMPETTAEFAEVLAAFASQDPNQNGEADEIPLSGAIGGGPSVQIWPFLMNSFIYTDDANYLKVDDGQISFVADTDEWRAGLEYLRGMYEDGLIDPQAFVQQGSQLRQMGEAPTPVMGAVTALWWGNFTVHKGPSGRWEEYVALSPLEGPEGVQWARTIPLQRLQMRGAITSDARDPRVVTRFVDYFYSQEGTIALFSGVPSEHWVWADDDQMGLTGEPAVYEQIAAQGSEPTRIAWRHIMPEYGSTEIQNGIYIEDERDCWIRGRLDRKTRENYTQYRRDDLIPPTLFFPEDVAQTEAELRTQLTESVSSFLVRFVTGDLSIENDWDAYVSQLERIGVEEYVSLYQDAYETYMNM